MNVNTTFSLSGVGAQWIWNPCADAGNCLWMCRGTERPYAPLLLFTVNGLSKLKWLDFIGCEKISGVHSGLIAPRNLFINKKCRDVRNGLKIVWLGRPPPKMYRSEIPKLSNDVEWLIFNWLERLQMWKILLNGIRSARADFPRANG